MHKARGLLFLAAILGLAGQVNATTSSSAINLQNLGASKVVKLGEQTFVKIADDSWMTTEPKCDDGLAINSVQNYAYTGGEQTFKTCPGHIYKLEVWGAAGGSANSGRGGYGGYSVGVYASKTDNTLYIYVGGAGLTGGRSTYTGGYNGGGSKSLTHTDSNVFGASGGGATHVATKTGLLSNLSSYKDTGGANISNEILIVAGGGGSAAGNYAVMTDIGGDGGGYAGVAGGTYREGSYYATGNGGTQTNGGTCAQNMPGGYASKTAGSFGSGGSSYSGGGGGWYGGCGQYTSTGGGSGYIASSNLISSNGITKMMKCYGCATSTAANTYTVSVSCANANHDGNCANTGNGYARITRLN